MKIYSYTTIPLQAMSLKEQQTPPLPKKNKKTLAESKTKLKGNRKSTAVGKYRPS